MTMPKWYDPKVTLGNLLTIVVMAAAALAAFNDLNAREQITSDQVAVLTARVGRLTSDHDLLIEIATSLKYLKSEIAKKEAQ
ncbi:MAG: hypothetical protein KGQ37_09385 [Hyphomicrobiales bacterium]|nr:hypothetical protein [Hyphomicrobiales bacterium]